MRCLLDKVIARHVLSGLLRLREGVDITQKEQFSLDLFERAFVTPLDLFVVPSSAQVVQRLAHFPRYKQIVRYFQANVTVVWPTRYYKRWARRLREYGFSREDAAILALATFGKNESGTILGMSVVTTYDQPLCNNWNVQYIAIQEHLAVMQQDIPAPYCDAPLPQILYPEQVVF